MTPEIIHQNNPVVASGVPLDQAKVAVIMLHSRGAGPQGILPLSAEFNTEDVAYLAPTATGYTWYPNRFNVAREINEPHLSSAMDTVTRLLNYLEEAGIPPEKTVLLGFSQGACLATEVASRNPKRYGAVVAFSGGLIGVDSELTGYEGSLEGTPVFLGCSDVDFHIPLQRVHDTRDIMTKLGAKVDERIYEGMGHTITQDEVNAVKAILASLV